MKKRSSIIVAVAVALACALFGPWVVREGRHYLHYQALDRKGKLKAEFASLATSSAPDGTLTVSASIRNTGSQACTQGEHYFALGVFERDGLRRAENVKFSDRYCQLLVCKDSLSG